MSIQQMSNGLLLVLMTSSAMFLGCDSGGRYHWDNVPYCKVKEGEMSSSFSSNSMRELTRHSNGGGYNTFIGQTPIRGFVGSDTVLIAIVSCQDLENRTSKPIVEVLEKNNVPKVCNNQKTIVEPVTIAAQPTTVAGYDGKLEFPAIPKDLLKCERGTLAYGSGADAP